jgi:hypothetical protein
MLSETFLDRSSVWLLYLITFAFLVIACELGFRMGRYGRSRWPEAGKATAGPIMGSALGLLAFLLAFTFGMSSSRFDARKQLVLDEAASILVAYKRAESLPEPQKSACTQLLRDYVQQRVGVGELESIEEIQALVFRSENTQDALWAQAVSLSAQPNAILSGFMQSLSSLTEYQMMRVRAASWNSIPEAIVLALYGIAFFGLSALGFNAGLNAHRPIFPALMLILAFSFVIILIIDLERPRQQLFHVSQEPIMDVARRIQVDLP